MVTEAEVDNMANQRMKVRLISLVVYNINQGRLEE
jgi:hypothetical protein